MSFGRRQVPIVARETIGPYTVLHTADTAIAAPGQFFMVAAAQRWGGGEDERPYLARALSTLAPSATFFLHDVGPGTRRLCELGEGEELALVGPLGGPFPPPAAGQRPVLVAGGVGVPPIAFLARSLVGARVLCGFRDAAHAAAVGLFDGPVETATDDGSAGHHGLVTDLLVAALDAEPDAIVYACGPPAMLEAIRALCVGRGVRALLALEAPMACGFGACYGCVVGLRDGGYARTCVDGPVIDAALLERVPA